MKGTIYFIANQSMPGLVKVGHTTGRLNTRLQQLNSTGVPKPFFVIASFSVLNSSQCEKELHQQLKHFRGNPKREFFTASPVELIKNSLRVLEKYLISSTDGAEAPKDIHAEYIPDNDDVYFMTWLLHDGYEQAVTFSSKELAAHHDDYSPIELDLKFMKLEEFGYIKRVNKTGLGDWLLLPKGMKFMIEGNHHFQDLLTQSRKA